MHSVTGQQQHQEVEAKKQAQWLQIQLARERERRSQAEETAEETVWCKPAHCFGVIEPWSLMHQRREATNNSQKQLRRVCTIWWFQCGRLRA